MSKYVDHEERARNLSAELKAIKEHRSELIISNTSLITLLAEKDADLQRIKGEIARLEIALHTHKSYDQTASELHVENERLRAAIAETLTGIGNAYEFGYLKETDEGDVQRMIDRLTAGLSHQTEQPDTQPVDRNLSGNKLLEWMYENGYFSLKSADMIADELEKGTFDYGSQPAPKGEDSDGKA